MRPPFIGAGHADRPVYALVARRRRCAAGWGPAGPSAGRRMSSRAEARAARPRVALPRSFCTRRDPTFRDQRGPRALRVRSEQAQGGVRVGVASSSLRPSAAFAGHGAGRRDVGEGGSGCRLSGARALPPVLTGWTTGAAAEAPAWRRPPSSQPASGSGPCRAAQRATV